MNSNFFPVTKGKAPKMGVRFSDQLNREAPFPTMLRELRQNKGVSQAEVAKQIGSSQSAVGQWELGFSLPDARAVAGLAAYYGVSADCLLGLSSTGGDDSERAEASRITGLSMGAIMELQNRKKRRAAFLYPFLDLLLRPAILDRVEDCMKRAAEAGAVAELRERLVDENPESWPGFNSPQDYLAVGVDEENFKNLRLGAPEDRFAVRASDARELFLTLAKDLLTEGLGKILEGTEQTMRAELLQNAGQDS